MAVLSEHLCNVRLFTGRGITAPTTLSMDGGVITAIGERITDPAARITDVGGAVALPGLIDSHLHLYRRRDLETLADFGVTTAVDMASWPPERTNGLRRQRHCATFLSAGVPFIGPAGPHSKFDMPAYATVTDPAEVPAGVERRLADGSDFIKIVLEAPGDGGPAPEIADAVVVAAHEKGARVVAHTAAHGAVETALRAGVDVITHLPMDEPVDAELAARLADAGTLSIPTMTMMKVMSVVPGRRYATAAESLRTLRAAGVPVLAGTDSINVPRTPVNIRLGHNLHHELELLVEAGWSPLEALLTATEAPAEHWGLSDRGRLRPGARADILLCGDNPLGDISRTRDVRGVYVLGERVV